LKKREQFKESWLVNHRVNLRLLEAVGEEGLTVSYDPRARNVRRIYVHMHNARLNWVGAMMKHPPEVARLKTREPHTIPALIAALTESSDAVVAMLEQVAKEEKVRHFERSPATLLSMMIAHEAHHRGQIVLAMRLSGKPLPREVSAALWDWDEI
jgi:uncharacterized damage-inducible protein DinB